MYKSSAVDLSVRYARTGGPRGCIYIFIIYYILAAGTPSPRADVDIWAQG